MGAYLRCCHFLAGGREGEGFLCGDGTRKTADCMVL